MDRFRKKGAEVGVEGGREEVGEETVHMVGVQ